MCDIYFLADKAVGFADQLADMTSKYFELFMKLLPHCAVPKLHMMLHIPLIMKWKGYYVNTFACERKHIMTKAFAKISKGHYLERKQK